MKKRDLQFKQRIRVGLFRVDMSTAGALAWGGARQQNDALNMIKNCSEMVYHWPYPGKPSDLAAYSTLTVGQWKTLMYAMDLAVQKWVRRSEKARKRGK